MHPLLYIIIVPIGWLWLHIRYGKEERQSVLHQNYESSYSHAGYIFMLRIVLNAILLAVFALVALSIYRASIWLVGL